MPSQKDGFLAFGNHIPKSAKCVYQLSRTEDLFEAASHLYDGLHTLDSQNIDTIHVAPLPKNSIGRAIYDRLIRASYKEKEI
jgi:L-threonylcarbamoyladenylate synthase